MFLVSRSSFPHLHDNMITMMDLTLLCRCELYFLTKKILFYYYIFNVASYNKYSSMGNDDPLW